MAYLPTCMLTALQGCDSHTPPAPRWQACIGSTVTSSAVMHNMHGWCAKDTCVMTSSCTTFEAPGLEFSHGCSSGFANVELSVYACCSHTHTWQNSANPHMLWKATTNETNDQVLRVFSLFILRSDATGDSTWQICTSCRMFACDKTDLSASVWASAAGAVTQTTTTSVSSVIATVFAGPFFNEHATGVSKSANWLLPATIPPDTRQYMFDLPLSSCSSMDGTG